MTGWKKANFSDLPDTSPEGVDIQWRFGRKEVGSDALGVSRFTYAPGARMPFGHSHREQPEAYVVLAGSGRAKLDDEIVELAEGDLLHVDPPVVRSFEAGPDGMELVCIGGRRPDGGDNLGAPDFWV